MKPLPFSTKIFSSSSFIAPHSVFARRRAFSSSSAALFLSFSLSLPPLLRSPVSPRPSRHPHLYSLFPLHGVSFRVSLFIPRARARACGRIKNTGRVRRATRGRFPGFPSITSPRSSRFFDACLHTSLNRECGHYSSFLPTSFRWNLAARDTSHGINNTNAVQR